MVPPQASGPAVLHRTPIITSTHSVTFNPVITSTTYLGHSTTGLHQQPQASPVARQMLIPPPGGAPMMSLNYYQPQSTAGQHTAIPLMNQEQPIIPSVQALRTTAVNQDLVQQRLQQLNQCALPQQPVTYFLITQHITQSQQQQINPKLRKRKLRWSGPRIVLLWATSGPG